MTTLHAALVTTDALVALLQSNGLLVGDGVPPAGGDWAAVPGESIFNPYVIVYGLNTMSGGTLRNPDETADIVYQMSCVGRDRRQAEWLADRVRNILLASTLTVTGRKVMIVRFDRGMGTIREDIPGQPSIFQAADRYRVWTEPS